MLVTTERLCRFVTDPELSETERAERMVEIGADALTANYGSETWMDLIDVDLLDIGDSERCILGQLFGDYNTGGIALGLKGDADLVCGLNNVSGDGGVRMNALTAAWKQLLS